MNIHIKLFKHQKELLTAKDNMIYLRAGRGSGKSFIASLIAALRLIEGKRIICLGQNFKQVSEVLFTEVVNRLYELIPNKFTVNKSSMKITYKSGTIYFASYESLETLRGFSDIALAICDEAALANENLFTVLTFCMRGEGIKPQIILISTPRPSNWLTRFVNESKVRVITAKTSDNALISEEQIELMKKTCNDENAWRREFFGEETEDESAGILFPMNLMEQKAVVSYNTKVFSIGSDCSGFGKDNNVLVLRLGNEIKEIYKKQLATGAELFNKIFEWLTIYGIENCSGIFIDEAFGDKLYERLIEKNYPAYLIPFAGKPDDEVYQNKRSEMYFKLSMFVKENTMIGISKDLKDELNATRYKLNDRNKIALIPKDEIKEIIGHSPDTADALALTFAMSDIPRGVSVIEKLRQSSYLGD